MAIEQLERPRATDAFITISPSRREATSSGAPTALAGVFARVGLQAALGYEWLLSGLDKLLYGRFPESLGGLLAGVLSGGAVPTPFASLLRVVALPNAALFGWLVEWSETLAGLALLTAAFASPLWPTLERRLAPRAWPWLERGRRMVDGLALGAAAGTMLLGLSFYLLDGAPAFWPVPSIAFGGALDTGLLLAALATPLALYPALSWLRRRLPRRLTSPQPSW